MKKIKEKADRRPSTKVRRGKSGLEVTRLLAKAGQQNLTPSPKKWEDDQVGSRRTPSSEIPRLPERNNLKDDDKRSYIDQVARSKSGAELDQLFNLAASIAGLPAADVVTLEPVSATSSVPAEFKPRMWAARDADDRRSPAQWITDEWTAKLGQQPTRAELRGDLPLYNAYAKWIKRHPQDDLKLLTAPKGSYTRWSHETIATDKKPRTSAWIPIASLTEDEKAVRRHSDALKKKERRLGMSLD